MQVHVSRLRKALGDPDLLTTRPAGYELRVRPGELDSERFERLVEEGRRALAEGRAEHAATVLREALALWRGSPLAEVTFEPFAQAEIARLEEQRLAALEARIEAELAAGRHAMLIGQLQQLVAENPTRERLAGLLMLALYRCERQADALQVYQDARRALVEDLGIEPGEGLRELETGGSLRRRQSEALEEVLAAAHESGRYWRTIVPLHSGDQRGSAYSSWRRSHKTAASPSLRPTGVRSRRA